MKVKRFITALGAVFVLGITLAGCGGGSGPTIASVAGNPISKRAFNHWMYVQAKSLAAQNPGSPLVVPEDPPNFNQCISNARALLPQLAKTPTKTLRGECQTLFTSLQTQVMDFLIKAYWYQAEAAREHITVSDAQVRKAFTTAKKSQFPTDAQYKSFLAQTGQTEADILYRFRINQLFTKLSSKVNGPITPAKIAAYYQRNKSSFGTPETRDIHIVLTRSLAQASAAKAALQAKQSWAAVAKKYSIDPTSKNNGGLLSGVQQGTQDTALDKAAFGSAAGKLVGPVHGQFGYYLIEVIRVHAATEQTLAQATPQIRSALAQLQAQNAQTAVDGMAKKFWFAKTTCSSLYAMADCHNYKAKKGTSTPSTTTPSG